MKKKRFDQLVESLNEVREHIATNRFGGRVSDLTVNTEDIRAVRDAPPTEHRRNSQASSAVNLARNAGVVEVKKGVARRRKYQASLLITMLRKAAALRNDMRDAGFTDNGGAIHSAERILNILGLCLNYPELSHINKLRHLESAIFSIEALALYKSGGKVLIEHVSPTRDLTRKVIEEIDRGANDVELETFVRDHYHLVLLTPDEALRLNQQNRSKMSPDRLDRAGIRLASTDCD